MTARVFVPLVGANGEGAQLFEAIAGEVAPEAHPARLVPQISELFDFGLYGVGQAVREAVTRFVAARRARLWLSRRNGRVHPWNLRISDLQIGRLSDENARSAGLGLALAAHLPGLCARPRRRLRHRGNPAALGARRAGGRHRPGRRRARQAVAGRRLYRSASPGARRQADVRRSAGGRDGRARARRRRGGDARSLGRGGARGGRAAGIRLRRLARRRRGGARPFRHARDRDAGARGRARRRARPSGPAGRRLDAR